MIKSLLTNIHPSWHNNVSKALSCVDEHFLESIIRDPTTLPIPEKLFNAFSLPLEKTRFILFGESPYPRIQSANGYAFWDDAVDALWSPEGFSKAVNRATSLRNIMKMLLVADNQLDPNNTTQAAIAKLDKSGLIIHGKDLFHRFMDEGILLLNASLSYRSTPLKKQDAKAWLPFINELLILIAKERTNIELLLFGKIASIINTLEVSHQFKRLNAEHPYNLSFINNTNVLEFFRKKKILRANKP